MFYRYYNLRPPLLYSFIIVYVSLYDRLIHLVCTILTGGVAIERNWISFVLIKFDNIDKGENFHAYSPAFCTIFILKLCSCAEVSTTQHPSNAFEKFRYMSFILSGLM